VFVCIRPILRTGTTQPCGHVRIRRPLASVWIRLYVWTVRKRVAPHHTDHWGLLQQKCTVTHTHTAQQSTLFKTRSISADCSLWNCTLPRTVGHGWSLQLLGGHANDPMMGLGQCGVTSWRISPIMTEVHSLALLSVTHAVTRNASSCGAAGQLDASRKIDRSSSVHWSGYRYIGVGYA